MRRKSEKGSGEVVLEAKRNAIDRVRGERRDGAVGAIRSKLDGTDKIR